jgi:hypothetical protein
MEREREKGEKGNVSQSAIKTATSLPVLFSFSFVANNQIHL